MRMISKLYYIYKDFVWQMTRKNIGAFAASISFFMFLSMIPLLIMLCAIIPYTALTKELLISVIEQFTPNAVNSMTIGVINEVYEKSAGTITIFAIVTLWSGAKAMLALIRGLNEVYDFEERRNYFVLRGIACFYTLMMLIAIVVSLLVMVFGNVIIHLVLSYIPQIGGLIHLVRHFRFVFSWAVLTLIFSAIYSFIPSRKFRYKTQIPGAIFSAIAWSIASYAFSVYVDHFNGFSTYGSLTTVVILMLWFYMMMYILMIGAHINKYFGPVYKFLFGWLDKSDKRN